MPFYGWTMAAVGLIVTLCSGPGQTYVFAVFVDPILESTGLPRTSISLLYAIATVIGALSVVVVGRMVDRFGAKSVIIVLGIGFGISCFWMAAAGSFLTLLIGFAGLRAFGGSSLPVASTLLVNQWFVRMRGRALAISGLGIAASSALLPPLARLLINAFDWRAAYFTLGLLALMVILPLTMLLVRSRPEDVGLLPDGAPPAPLHELPVSDPNLGNLPRRIYSSPVFWLLALPLSAPTFVATALIFHQVSIFGERGLSPELAAAVFIPNALASAGVMLVSGFVIDRTGPRQLLYLALTISLLSIVVLQITDNPAMAVLYSVLFGMSGGMQSVVSSVTWPYYYGRHGLGKVMGAATMVNIALAALGPLPAAAIQQRFGDYSAVLMLLGVILLLCLTATFVQRYVPMPRRLH